ncbi:MAG: hypothetical protein HZA54_16240 [Planctomycetes bacterium]|nr:hypothetical protein [Planctomycetota bacterium]
MSAREAAGSGPVNAVDTAELLGGHAAPSAGTRAERLREAQALADERRFAEAEVAYEAILIATPDSWIAANNLGALRARTGDAEAALACYLRAWEPSGGHEAVAVNLADAYLRLGRLAETATTCTAALARGCRSGPIYHALIEAAARLHKYDLAAATIEEYRPQIRDQQEFFTVSLTLLECFVAQGRTVGIPQIAEDLLALTGSERPERWYMLARLLRQSGHPDFAYRTLARVARITPEGTDLEFQLLRDFEQIDELVRAVYATGEAEALAAFRSLARFRTAKVAHALRPLARHDQTMIGKLAKDYVDRVERNRPRDPGLPRLFTSFAPTLLPPIAVVPEEGPESGQRAGVGDGAPALKWRYSPPELPGPGAGTGSGAEAAGGAAPGALGEADGADGEGAATPLGVTWRRAPLVGRRAPVLAAVLALLLTLVILFSLRLL